MAESSLPKGLIFGGAALALFAVLGTGAILFVATQESAERTPHIVKHNKMLDVSSAAKGSVVASADGYVPSSQYVEPGADSDEVTLGFSGKEPVAQNNQEPIDDAEVQEAVYENQNDLITCYAEALERDEDLQGRVAFHFRIAPDGHVAMVKVTQSELADHDTEECFVDAAKGWKFPKTHVAQLLKFDTDFTFAY